MDKLLLIRLGQITQIKEELEKLKVHLENNLNSAKMALFRTNGFSSIEIDSAVDAINEVAKSLKKYKKLKARIRELENEA